MTSTLPADAHRTKRSSKAPEAAQLHPKVLEIVELAALGDKEAALAIAYFTGPAKGIKSHAFLSVHPNVTPESARVMAVEAFRKPETINYLKDLAMSSGLTKELINYQVAAIASSDISDLAGVNSLNELKEMHPSVRAAVKKLKKTVRPDGSETLEFELHSKDAALSLGAEIVGLKKNQPLQGPTLTIILGEGLGIEDDYLDVTPDQQ